MSINRDNSQIRVLLTGASGYLAGHILNLLLERGYKVRGTVRSLQNPKKIDHLYQINPSKRANLELVEADLTNKVSWEAAMKNVDYVIHTASPVPQTVPKNEDEVIKPAVEGTETIFETALKNGVKKIVMTSSTASVSTGNTNKNYFTSSDWSNTAQSPPYEKSKTLAEKKAWEIYEKNKSRLQMTVILPGYIQGPSFHANDYISADFIKKVMKNEFPGIPKIGLSIIDVRDCALAHVLALDQDKLEITNGKRYILTEESKFLLSIAACIDKQVEVIKPYFQRRIIFDNSQTMKDLGIQFRHHRETIIEFAYDLISKGCIPNKLPKLVQVSPEIRKS